MTTTPTPEERIAALESQVAALERELQDFTYTVSHDLRAPLRHIVSFAKLVQMESADQLDAEAQGFLGNVVDSAALMGRMLDGLLAISRVGAQELQWQDMALAEVVQSCVQTVQGRYPQHTVQWQAPAHLPVLRTDPALLQQAVLALLDNAWKFTGGKADAAVTLALEQADARLRLRLQDNGAGFATQQVERLGLPFVRLHSASQFDGVGLGLALARKCVQRLGGRLQLEATPAQGCCVTLELPH
ncbi:ATP-binding protein [Curvibacter sp. APW13]|uniref:sensor histidine kinase n=1 Tax=Curvibacter sp. APW13 TaxID=3077236 RepID=UPI0028DF69E7|nr:ATP-binding protein [Curvibacter sp. APW13]MDT8992688.1 ATP-binding protein [Curvibacter sp. APW13]